MRDCYNLSAVNKSWRPLKGRQPSLNSILIAGRGRRLRKKIIIIHSFLLRYIFSEFSKIPGESKDTATPDLPGGIRAIEILVLCDRFIVMRFFVVVHGSQRNIDLVFKYF